MRAASVGGLSHFKSKTTSTRLQHRNWRSQALTTNRWFDNWQGLRSGVCGGQACAYGGQSSRSLYAKGSRKLRLRTSSNLSTMRASAPRFWSACQSNSSSNLFIPKIWAVSSGPARHPVNCLNSPDPLPGRGFFFTKKPRRLGRGFCSILEETHRPLGGGQCSQQRYLTTSQRAEQINFRLWAGGHFTLRKPLCAYGLIAHPVQLSALPGRAPTNRPSPPRSGLFLFRAAS